MIKTELKNQCFNLTGKKCLKTGQCGECPVAGIVAGLKAGEEAGEEARVAKAAAKAARTARVKASVAQVIAKKTIIHIWTDGACSGNPGPGGWGVVIKNGKVRELSGGSAHTTNNQMELTGAIEALKSLKARSIVILTTDSKYVMDGLTQWLPNWKRNGWKTYDRKPVKNVDLWRELDTQCKRHSVEWKWVKGHAGHPENERCDELARLAIVALHE
jgi:ribonuclease HI